MLRFNRWTATAACWLLALPAAAAAPDQATLQAYHSGVDQLVALVNAHQTGFAPDSPAATEAHALIAWTFSEPRLLDFTDVELDDLARLSDICQGANQVMVALAMAGARSQIDPDQGRAAAAAKLMAVMDSNGVRYQDFTAPIMPFLTRCLALQSRAAIGVVERIGPTQLEPVRRAGLARMRDGLSGFVLGATIVAGDGRYSLHNRALVLDSLNAHVGALLHVLPMPMREPLLAAVDAASAHADATLAPALASLRAALDQVPCALLCNVLQIGSGPGRPPSCLSQPILLGPRTAPARLCAVGGNFVHHDYYVDIDGKRAIGDIDDEVAKGVRAELDGNALSLQCVPEHQASGQPVDDGLVKALMAKMPDANEAQAHKVLERLNAVEIARNCELRVNDVPQLSVRVEQPQ